MSTEFIWTRATKQQNFRAFRRPEAEAMIEAGAATGGMIPKLQNLIQVIARGVRSAHVIGGSERNALLSEVFTDEGTGTMII
jgi:acetylglutamate kinase